MGVYGLWRLLDATGKQVPLETLEGKVLAVDISIWIHQVLQGYQDRFGNPKPNAHLLGLYSRICKLLYYKIKPVFVFDGSVPLLKKDTVASRRKQKSTAKNKAEQMRAELINNLMKHSAVMTVLNPDEKNLTNNSSGMVLKLQNKQTVDNMFNLPDMPSTSRTESNVSDDYDSDSSTELNSRKQNKWIGNIHSVNVSSTEFKALPADVRYDILTDLKDTRKQNSWGRLHEMPKDSHEFSGYQMKRLLQRRLVQESLEAAENEMGGKTLTLDELEKLLTEQGVTNNDNDNKYRIAGDSTTRLIYINDKNAWIKSSSSDVNLKDENNTDITDETNKSVATANDVIPICEDINEYAFDDEWDSDIETKSTSSKLRMDVSSDSECETELNETQPLRKKYFGKDVINPALSYMLEHSGLTDKQIRMLLEQKKKEDRKNSIKIITEESEETDLPTTEQCENKNTTANIQPCTSMSKDNETAKRDSIETKSFHISDADLPATTASAPNNEQIKEADVHVISSTDSDSDFIEVENSLTSNVNTDNNAKTSQQSIEITFKAHEKVEDDIFSDIFETSGNDLLSKETPEEWIDFPHREEMKDEIVSKESETVKKRSEPDNINVKVIEGATNVEDKESEKAKERNEESSDITKADNINVKVTEEATNVEDKDKQSEKNETEETNGMTIPADYEIDSPEIVYEDDIIVDSNRISPLPVNEAELVSLKEKLEDAQTELVTNIGKFERQGMNISQRIKLEAQELLRLFGVPYVDAPMEAEAQCAYLEQIHLTDGTITDDSDIWLFGGQCVYKNFFDNNKTILQYRSSDIQHHFKLTRNEMIQLALLVGSDYTMGVTGIGPVTALEILATFPSDGTDLLRGLTNFYSWIQSGKVVGPGRTALRNKLQNVQIHKGFPSQAVVQAYLFPVVDESKESFTWSKPNLTLLLNYTKQKFGWTKVKFDEVMTPVVKKLEGKQSQKSIKQYIKVQNVPKSIELQLSKRVQKAVQRLNNPEAEDFEDAESARQSEQQQSKRKKSKSSNVKRRKNESKSEENVVDSAKSKIINISTGDKNLEEHIPQREKDKAEALKKRLHAIEVVRKSKQGLYKTKKVKRCVRKVKNEAELSESDSS